MKNKNAGLIGTGIVLPYVLIIIVSVLSIYLVFTVFDTGNKNEEEANREYLQKIKDYQNLHHSLIQTISSSDDDTLINLNEVLIIGFYNDGSTIFSEEKTDQTGYLFTIEIKENNVWLTSQDKQEKYEISRIGFGIQTGETIPLTYNEIDIALTNPNSQLVFLTQSAHKQLLENIQKKENELKNNYLDQNAILKILNEIDKGGLYGKFAKISYE